HGHLDGVFLDVDIELAQRLLATAQLLDQFARRLQRAQRGGGMLHGGFGAGRAFFDLWRHGVPFAVRMPAHFGGARLRANRTVCPPAIVRPDYGFWPGLSGSGAGFWRLRGPSSPFFSSSALSALSRSGRWARAPVAAAFAASAFASAAFAASALTASAFAASALAVAAFAASAFAAAAFAASALSASAFAASAFAASAF